MDKRNEDKPLDFVGSALEDLRNFPNAVKQRVGLELRRVQKGGKPRQAKPLKGFSGASVLEIIENHDGDTYRAVYTVRFKEIVYVLHCFQKKSKKGIATPKNEIDLIKRRLKEAEADYQKRFAGSS